VSTGIFSSEEVPRSPEEILQLKNLPATTHGMHISSDYFLIAKPIFDGTDCCECTKGPAALLPLTVIPVSYKY